MTNGNQWEVDVGSAEGSAGDAQRRDVATVRIDGVRTSVRSTGSGPAVLLLHGFPHTKELWRAVEALLVAAGLRVVAPDLRGLGDTEPGDGRYDARHLALDQVGLLDALSLRTAHVVGFDLGAAPAFALAASNPGRVESLTVVEAVTAGLPGAESFVGSGGPWWFAFHQAPGELAEDVVAGSEDRYVRFFLDTGSRAGVPVDLARHFVRAYTGRDRLHAAFEHYRAIPGNADGNQSWAAGGGRLRMPVTAVGASTLRDIPARQLAPVCDDLVEHVLPDSGHIVPLDAARELADIVLATVGRVRPPS